MNKLIERPKYLDFIRPFIGKPIIKVLTGQRRVGKSFLLRQIETLIDSNQAVKIIHIDKEDAAFEFIKTSENLTTYIHSKASLESGEKNFIFIDEIQEISGFENSIRSFAAKEQFDIYITGSNSEMLSGELATRLSGRYIEIPVYSLDFLEFCDFHLLEAGKDALDLYLRYGGMPFLKHLKLEPSQTYEYLTSVLNTILFRDVITRYNIRNANFMDRLVHFLADNVGSIVHAKRISEYLKSQKISISVNTILDYLHYLTASQMVISLKRIDIRGKKIFEIGEKYYFQDWGIRNAIAGYKPGDIQKILENCVLHHLCAHKYKVFTGSWNEKEIDFVAEKNNEKIYIQVTYRLLEKSTIKREFGNLLEIKNNYRKIVVSLDDFNGNSFEGIEHIHLFKFLKEFK